MIQNVFALTDALKALEVLEDGYVTGKIVLAVNDNVLGTDTVLSPSTAS